MTTDRPSFPFPSSLARLLASQFLQTRKRKRGARRGRKKGDGKEGRKREEGRGHSFLPSAAPQHELGIPLFGGSRQALAACDQSDLLFGTNGAMLEKVRRSEVSRDDVSGRRENGWMSCRGRSVAWVFPQNLGNLGARRVEFLASRSPPQENRKNEATCVTRGGADDGRRDGGREEVMEGHSFHIRLPSAATPLFRAPSRRRKRGKKWAVH